MDVSPPISRPAAAMNSRAAEGTFVKLAAKQPEATSSKNKAPIKSTKPALQPKPVKKAKHNMSAVCKARRRKARRQRAADGH